MSVWRRSAATLTALVTAPVAAGALAVMPSWRAGWRERVGGGVDLEPGAIWVHAASVGETRAAFPLIDALGQKGERIAFSTTTRTGRDVVRKERPEIPHRMAPIDHPWCVSASLARVKPRGLVLIETELWPSWIAASERSGVPVVLVSGRISDRSYPRYRRIAPFLRRTLGRIRAIGARTELDRDRFVDLGAPADRVRVTGDLKLEPGVLAPPIAPDIANALGSARLLVAASTHRGEEAAALDALARCESRGEGSVLLLAPRYPDRASEVAALARGCGRRVELRSALRRDVLSDGDVLVLDTLGELASLFARSEGAFVGGTLVAIGGHNILEPVMAGRPVAYGPHVSNVQHAVDLLSESRAGTCVADGEALGDEFATWLSDPERAREAAARGREAAGAHRGSAERAATLVLASLGGS